MCVIGNRVRNISNLYNLSYLFHNGDPHILLDICIYIQLEESHMSRELHMDCCCRHYSLFVGNVSVSLLYVVDYHAEL